MRVHHVVCPSCQSTLTSKAGVEEGTSLACPKCKNRFKVPVLATEVQEIAEDFEVVEDDEPAPKPKRKSRADDEDDRPRAKRRRDDEDEDDRPRSKRRRDD